MSNIELINSTDLFLIRTAIQTTIKKLEDRQEKENEVAIPQVIKDYQITLNKVNELLKKEELEK